MLIEKFLKKPKNERLICFNECVHIGVRQQGGIDAITRPYPVNDKWEEYLYLRLVDGIYTEDITLSYSFLEKLGIPVDFAWEQAINNIS